MDESDQLQLRRLTSALLDNVLEPDSRESLVSLLKSSPQARRVYLHILLAESAMQWETASANESTRAQPVSTPIESKIVPWYRTAYTNPLQVARNWVAGAIAATLAFAFWFTSSPNRASSDAPEIPVAQDLQPIKTETQNVEGHTVASMYFRFDPSNEGPEG